MGMTLLILGVALWSGAHLFKRLAPGMRAALGARMGEGAKGLLAALLVAAIVLMVLGYQRADYVGLWLLPAWAVHLNNLLVLIGFYVFGIGMARGPLSQRLRHPMLLGTLIWAAAHLLVQGHLAGLILFGGLGLWAVAAMVLINAQEGGWMPKPPKGGPKRDMVAGVIVVAVYLVVGFVHGWLGPSPFGGGM